MLFEKISFINMLFQLIDNKKKNKWTLFLTIPCMRALSLYYTIIISETKKERI